MFANNENTRFVPIDFGSEEIDLVGLANVWPQVIAQARTLFDKGEPPFLPRDKEHLQREQNRSREITSREEDAVNWYLDECGDDGMKGLVEEQGVLLSTIHMMYGEHEYNTTGIANKVELKRVDKSYGRAMRKRGLENGYSTDPKKVGVWWFTSIKGMPPRKR